MSATFSMEASPAMDFQLDELTNSVTHTMEAKGTSGTAEISAPVESEGQPIPPDLKYMTLDEVLRDTCSRVRNLESTQGAVLTTIDNFRAEAINLITSMAGKQTRMEHLISAVVMAVVIGFVVMWYRTTI